MGGAHGVVLIHRGGGEGQEVVIPVWRFYGLQLD
jgi:hypothetical protein